MSIFSRMLGGSTVAAPARVEPVLSAAAEVSGIAQPAGWLGNFGGAGTRVATLPTVSPEIALRHGTVYSCVDIIAGDLAKVNLQLFQKGDTGEDVRVKDHPVDWLLNNESSPGVPAIVTRYAMAHGFALRGNGYGYAPRDGGGEVMLIDHIHNDGVQMYRAGRERFYEFVDAEGVRRKVPSRMVAHLRYASRDGWLGRSPIMESAESVGIALAGQEAAGRDVSGVHIKAYITSGENWEDDEKGERDARKVRDLLNDPKSNGVPMLPEGADIKTLGISAVDRELLANRRFDRQQILALYRMPPSKVAIDDAGVKAGVEQQAIDYLTDCLLHWATQLEKQAAISLLTEKERRSGMFLRHNLDSILRATTKDRVEAHVKAAGGPYATINEIRKIEGKPPIAGGDELLPPPNMTKEFKTEPKPKGKE